MKPQLEVKMIVYHRGSVELYRYENDEWRLTLRRKSADSALKFLREHESNLELVGIHMVKSEYADIATLEVGRFLKWWA